MDSNHSPTPWKVEGSIYEHMAAGIASAGSGEERGIAQVWKHAKAMDDAHFIVRAVNSYEANQSELAKLRAALEMIAGIRPCPDNLMGNPDIARAALASINGAGENG